MERTLLSRWESVYATGGDGLVVGTCFGSATRRCLLEQRKGLRDDSRLLAIHCARFLDENKLEDITVFEVGAFLGITDYFIVATGRNGRHLKAASDKLLKDLRERGVKRLGVEGYEACKWVLVDLVDAVVHLFDKESRKFYDLELLWGDCARLDWSTGHEGIAASESTESLRRVAGDS